MSSAAMASPSKIPLPKSRMAAAASASAAASAEDLSAASPVHVSRIPKAVSPERAFPPPPTQPHAAKSEAADDKENDFGLIHNHNNGWEGGGSKHRGGSVDGSATFVRRPSPPRSALPSERSDAPENPEVVIDERVLEQKLQQSRDNNAKNSSARKSSTTSAGSAGSGSRIPVMASSTGASPVRQPAAPAATSPQRKYSPPQPAADPEHPSRSAADQPPALHLELSGSASKIPLPSRSGAKRSANSKTPQTSPSKLPTVGFSFSPERMASSSASSSPLKKPSSSHSTSNLPVAGGKKFEAFVMTGDRMINLAKTPANHDFKSKFNKSISESNILRNRSTGAAPAVVSLAVEESFEIDSSKDSDGGDFEASNGLARRREQPVARRPLMRTSQSEDTLLPAAAAAECAEMEVDAGSAHTLIHDHDRSRQTASDRDASGVIPGITPLAASATPSPRGKGPPPPPPPSSSRGSPAKRVSPEEVSSMTSSFMSCSSEHYKAVESVLENRISPDASSTSPDTPEWSLTDSVHKRNNGHVVESQQQALDESITSRGNKVIISIGDSNRSNSGERKSSTSSLRSPTSHSSGTQFN